MAQVEITYTNAVIAKSPVPFYNMVYGCDVYEDNAHAGDSDYYRFVSLKENGEPVVMEIIGYTKLYEWRFTDKIIPNLDGVYDLSQFYTELSNFNPADSPQLARAINRLRYDEIKEGEVLTGIKNLKVYTK